MKRLFTAALLLLAAGAALADDRFDVASPVYQSECGSCHVAFPPRLLSAADWQRVLGRLDRHYGSDASLDAATLARVRDFVLPRAGTGKRVAAVADMPMKAEDLPRISTRPWFQREHRRVADRVGTPQLKSFTDCAACHRGAAEGDYDEHAVRLPPRKTP